MKKAQKQTSQENGLSASFLDLKSVQKAPQNAITLTPFLLYTVHDLGITD